MIKATFADGMEIDIRHDGRNGIEFEGTKGTLFATRGKVTGKAVDELATNPLPRGRWKAFTKTVHWWSTRATSLSRLSPAWNRSRMCLATTERSRHALGRDCGAPWPRGAVGPKNEVILNDKLAQSFIARERRKGFDIEM